MFKVIKKSKKSKARLGIIKTARGVIKTPFFMPDATRGVVKNLSNRELADLGLECFVANTLHLFLRPGLKLIKKTGGLHNFLDWQKPILTDSGGYQVYSLIHKNKSGKGRISDQGAFFPSPLDGASLKLTPEESIKIQFTLGAEMIVCLDDCPPNDYNDEQLARAVRRTIDWAKRCKRQYEKEVAKRGLSGDKKPLLFSVIQGGTNLALREFCARELFKIGFDGYGFGARHIDSAGRFLGRMLKDTADLIPENRPRFGLGIGTPADIVRAAKLGWDMFDCVIPTREGRHGRLFVEKKPGRLDGNFYETINITNARYSRDFSPINQASRLNDLRRHSKAYLNYLFKIKEPLALRLASLNNLEYYIKMLSNIRESIDKNIF